MNSDAVRELINAGKIECPFCGDKTVRDTRDLQREALEQVAARAVEAIAQVEEWLGSASTRQAAEESWHRLRLALRRAGYEMQNGCLEYRGSILRAMEHCGIGMDDEGVIRIRRYTDKPWMHASGVPLYEHLHRYPPKETKVAAAERGGGA